MDDEQAPLEDITRFRKEHSKHACPQIGGTTEELISCRGLPSQPDTAATGTRVPELSWGVFGAFGLSRCRPS